jgi:arylsulfatase
MSVQIGPISHHTTSLVQEHEEPPDPSHGMEHQAG